MSSNFEIPALAGAAGEEGARTPVANGKRYFSSPTSVTFIPKEKSMSGTTSLDMQPSLSCREKEVSVSSNIELKPPTATAAAANQHLPPYTDVRSWKNTKATGEIPPRVGIDQYLNVARAQPLGGNVVETHAAFTAREEGVQGEMAGDIFERKRSKYPPSTLTIDMTNQPDNTIHRFMPSPYTQTSLTYRGTNVEHNMLVGDIEDVDRIKEITPGIAPKQGESCYAPTDVNHGEEPATATKLTFSSTSIATPTPTATGKMASPTSQFAFKPAITSTATSFTSSTAALKMAAGCSLSSMRIISPPIQNTPNSKPNGIVSGPVLYVGITLERPETLNSWGLVFTKQRANHAMIVRVVSPKKGAGRPSVKWCQITKSAPNPSHVFRKMATSITPLDQYELSIAQNFPPPCGENCSLDAGLLVPYLTPGDAIISINGLPVSSFPNTGKFASYIRQNCQRKMVIVAMRHESVRKAALVQMARPIMIKNQQNGQGGLLDVNAMTDRVSKAVGEAWKAVLNLGGDIHHQAKRKMMTQCTSVKRQKIAHVNNAFRGKDGKPIPYCDNDDPDHYDGKRIRRFLNDEIENSFPEWLRKRKEAWAKRRPVERIREILIDDARDITEEEITLQHDFWVGNGYESFDHWLSASKTKWTRSYSWHKEGRNALQLECERKVHFPNIHMAASNIESVLLDQFENWLSVRKQQWRLDRRKRQRHRVEMTSDDNCAMIGDTACNVLVNNDPNICAANSKQDMYIDEILEDQERLTHREAKIHEPMDLSWLFDSQLGAPDDTIFNIMTFLHAADHGKLLCLSFASNFLFKQRNDMWRTLCPAHWVLPRRPRKSWCAIYITKIREEEEASRKRSDDLLVKANVIIEKGDQLTKLEKLINKAEKVFDFSVNYVSGVVLERNSLLNLAVIEKRHKITKWLVEDKGADIESCDRGQFTPLMNSAWNGDKYLVRYLLSKKCDRTKVGYNHSSQGMNADRGMTACEWARKRGHDEVAELIHLGL
eukprot:CAMPEP_0181134502 /NCGR_PEP_ID=MMETSP1071-20121207/32122_1 /TAXON_ID=35127 /ORGANISM="Thalassiosira sp., Strain NH16" /LENGTH=998 /DNA_ID=CAMNT_0023221025 /DNA_START=101 /DNA_END=3097 /DNA_ORIENTATION=+